MNSSLTPKTNVKMKIAVLVSIIVFSGGIVFTVARAYFDHESRITANETAIEKSELRQLPAMKNDIGTIKINLQTLLNLHLKNDGNNH